MGIADRIFEEGMLEDENSRTDLNFGDQYNREESTPYFYNKIEDKYETINEKNEKMGKMKEQFMQEREETINAMNDIAQNPNTNQLNNKMTKKTMQEKLTKQPEVVAETRSQALNRLYKENGLTAEDVHKDPRGFVTIKREGIDKISARNGITIGYEVVTMDVEKGICVLKAAGTMKVGNDVRNLMSFGEANNGDLNASGKSGNNLTGGGKKFPIAMAEKRAMSRVVLKLTGFYEQGVFGQDEIVD